jgi:hypothetical protein
MPTATALRGAQVCVTTGFSNRLIIVAASSLLENPPWGRKATLQNVSATRVASYAEFSSQSTSRRLKLVTVQVVADHDLTAQDLFRRLSLFFQLVCASRHMDEQQSLRAGSAGQPGSADG